MKSNLTKIFVLLICLSLFSFDIFAKEIKVEVGDKIEKASNPPTTEEEKQKERERFFVKMKEILKTRKKKGVLYLDKTGKYYTNGFYKFHLLPEDKSSRLAYIEYMLDRNSTYQMYKEPIHLKEEGTYKLTHRGVDVYGNVESDTTFTIIVDKKPPEVSAEIVGEYFMNDDVKYYKPGARLEVKALDRSSGLDIVIVNVNNKGNLPLDPQQPLVFDKPGTYKLNIRAMDKVANLSKKMILTFQIDGKKPVVAHKVFPEPRPIDKDIFCRVDSRVTLEADDVGSGVQKIEYSLDRSNWKEYKESLHVGKEPMFKVYYKAVDNVGNVSSEKDFTCRVDAISPESNIRLLNKP